MHARKPVAGSVYGSRFYARISAFVFEDATDYSTGKVQIVAALTTSTIGGPIKRDRGFCQQFILLTASGYFKLASYHSLVLLNLVGLLQRIGAADVERR